MKSRTYRVRFSLTNLPVYGTIRHTEKTEKDTKMTYEKSLEILLDMTPTVSTGWKPENLDELCKLESDNRGEKMLEETEMNGKEREND